MTGAANNGAAVLAGVVAHGTAAGEAAVTRASMMLAERTRAEFPDLAVNAMADSVVLHAPGVVARALGSRRRSADPRLVGLVALAIALGSET